MQRTLLRPGFVDDRRRCLTFIRTAPTTALQSLNLDMQLFLRCMSELYTYSEPCALLQNAFIRTKEIQ